MRDYGKVHSSFWSSATIRSLSDDGKMLAFYLLTSPHSTIAGVFRLPDGYVCEDIGWPSERVSKGFTELLVNGFCNRCETTKWVWVKKHFEWNQPENPNQWKSAKKIVVQVPDNCIWAAEFKRVFAIASGQVPFQESNPSETVQEPFLNQEQEQEQEQDKQNTSVGDKSPTCPHQEIISLYHELLPTGTAVRIWDGTRLRHLQARWREDPKRQNLAWWKRFFTYCATSPWLTSQVPPSNGHTQFIVALDWIVNPTNFAKIIEGRFHRESSAA